MILTFLLSILSGFLGFLIGFLPTGNLPVQISQSISAVWGYVNAFSYVIALDTLIQVLALTIAFDIIVLSWSLIQWVIRKIPGMQ